LVHVEHELMKVGAALAHDRARAKEQIHEHGLAAADIAEDVEALRRTGVVLAAPEQPPQSRRLARQPLVLEARIETGEPGGDRLLRGVALDLACSDEGSVEVANGGGHAGSRRETSARLEHDPEKLKAAFGKAWLRARPEGSCFNKKK